MQNKQRNIQNDRNRATMAGFFGAALLGVVPFLAGSVAHAADKDPLVDWVKTCGGKEGAVCVTRSEALDTATNSVFAPLAISKEKGKKDMMLRLTMPYYMSVPVKVKNKKTKKEETRLAPVDARWNVQSGAKMKIDKDNPIDLKFAFCYSVGCVAVLPADAAFVAKLKKGKIAILASQFGNRTLFLSVSLKGFGKALDGKPLDQKVYQSAWKKRIATYQKQRIDFLKKIKAAQEKAAKKK